MTLHILPNGAGGLTDDRPMKRGQIVAILLVILIAVIDGYDLMAMAFAAPVVSRQWGIDKASLGLLLAISLVGMAAGSLLLTPIADKLGRRAMVLWSLGLVTIATLVSGLSVTLPQLLASRLATGMGLGALVPLLSTLASEYANTRSRSFVVSCTAVGLPLGGAIGGAVSALILQGHDWHWVFLIGAIAGAVVLLIAVVALPESPAYLIARRPDNALERLNSILVKWGHDPLTSLPAARGSSQGSIRALFSPALVPHTLRLTAINVLMLIAGYYVLNWLPQIMANEGFSPSTAGMVSSTSSMVGFAGPLVLGALAMRFGARWMATLAMGGFGVALISLAFVPPLLPLLILAVSACAVCMSGSAAMFQAIAVETFPAGVRASAIGFIMGIGRIASGLGPYLAGLMFAGGMTRLGVSLSFSVLALIAGALMMTRRGNATPLAA
ncbi:MAG: MFS transporter [Pseudomonadota bacterium]